LDAIQLLQGEGQASRSAQGPCREVVANLFALDTNALGDPPHGRMVEEKAVSRGVV
jgi:hypothetical protein